MIRWEEVISGEIDGYPVEVIELALCRGLSQGYTLEEVVFQLQSSRYGGFTWANTPEGSVFWERVMAEKEFDLFYERYPICGCLNALLWD
jgi:hypothetical protein